MCSDGWNYPESEVDGECPECGNPTIGGEVPSGCFYSPVACEAFNDRPCDGSC